MSDALALVVPAAGEIVQPGIVEAFELDVRNRVRDIDDIDALAGPVDQMNALAKALAGTRLAPYARAAARRIEWRIGRLLGPPPRSAPDDEPRELIAINSEPLTPVERVERNYFRWIGTLELEWDALEPWAQDRAQLVRTARERLREPDDSELDIRHGDFATALADIEPGSVALILTDPPYAQKALPDYGRLGEFAAEKLVDGGSLVCYVGQTTLPGALEQIGRHLRYWWCLALNQQGRGQRLPGKWVRPKWKPVLWFVNGGRRDHVYVDDMLRGTIPAKQLHGWAQGVDEVLPLIQGLTEPGELVVDPFAGSGSFGIAAQHKLGRRFVGADDRSGVV